MKRLDNSRYKELIPLLDGAEINTLFARFVLQGKAEGEVFVDNEESPRTIYIRNNYGMSLLMGALDDEDFNTTFLDYMLNKEGQRERQEWMQVYPIPMAAKVEEMLGARLIKENPDGPYNRAHFPGGDKNVISYERVNFKFDRELFEQKRAAVKRTDKKIVETGEEIYNSLEGSVIPNFFWKSAEQFVREGKGFTLLEENEQPASTAFAAYMTEDILELGIETAKEHHGKGYAYEVSAALIEYCLENGYEPEWSCHSANIGSQRLAAKLGFVESLRLPYYRLVL